jgi:2-oxoglutarate ferredoxin oxidoreductase subunit delta
MRLWRRPFDEAESAPVPARITVDPDRCKGCGFCVEFCPKGALAMSQEMNAKGYLLPTAIEEGKCLGCGLCEVICPDFGIHVILAKEEE